MLGVSVEAELTDTDGAITDAVEQALTDAADVGFEKSQEKVAANSTDTGQLLKSGVAPHVMQDGSVVWGYNAPHAPYIEFGTEPHWPPIDPLLGWARRVLGDESAAYAVQKKIAEEGTEPEPFVRPGIEAMRRYFRANGIKGNIDDNLD